MWEPICFPSRYTIYHLQLPVSNNVCKTTPVVCKPCLGTKVIFWAIEKQIPMNPSHWVLVAQEWGLGMQTGWGESQQKLAMVVPNIIPTVGSKGRRNRRGWRIRFNDIAILSSSWAGRDPLKKSKESKFGEIQIYLNLALIISQL